MSQHLWGDGPISPEMGNCDLVSKLRQARYVILVVIRNSKDVQSMNTFVQELQVRAPAGGGVVAAVDHHSLTGACGQQGAGPVLHVEHSQVHMSPIIHPSIATRRKR